MTENPLSGIDVVCKKSYPVGDLFASYKDELHLSLLTPESANSGEISEPNLNRPALAFAGFTDVYSYHRIQIIGSTEWSYLESVGAEQRKKIFDELSRFHAPLWILTHSLPPHPELLEMCRNFHMPVMNTNLSTLNLAKALQKILEEWFAPYSAVHASLVDVYGVGMLYVGKSNIGKSECALDLVERGHRLVADDIVKLIRIGDSIIGQSNSIINHHMEIRGIGIIDVQSMFGIHAVRKVKKVEIVVELQHWNQESHYDRTGLSESMLDVLGIPLNHVTIPILPGKNITVISEVIAMNTLMKLNGIDAASEFNKNLLRVISGKQSKRPIATREAEVDGGGLEFYE